MSGDADDDGSAIDIAVDDPRWQGIPACVSLCRRAARAAVEAAGDVGDLSIFLTNDSVMRGLNRRYRSRDRATNVLAFPADSPSIGKAPRLAGDVCLSFETVRREAGTQGKSFEDHVAHLVVHGVLHLCGHDHETPAQAGRMESHERRILTTLGIANPYARETSSNRDAVRTHE